MKYISYQTASIQLKFGRKEFFNACVKQMTDDFKHISCDVITAIPNSKVLTNQTNLFFEAVRQASFGKYKRIVTRIKDSTTTHPLGGGIWGIQKDQTGQPVAPGYTKQTCTIDRQSILGKVVLLVDDMYTSYPMGCFVSRDCVQALLDNGAKQVIFYAFASSG
jgi:hypothetical protein